MSGNMLHVEERNLPLTLGVDHMLEIRKDVSWPTSNQAEVIILKTVDFIRYGLTLTGQMITACIVWQVTLPNGLLPLFMRTLMLSFTISILISGMMQKNQ